MIIYTLHKKMIQTKKKEKKKMHKVYSRMRADK